MKKEKKLKGEDEVLVSKEKKTMSKKSTKKVEEKETKNKKIEKETVAKSKKTAKTVEKKETKSKNTKMKKIAELGVKAVAATAAVVGVGSKAEAANLTATTGTGTAATVASNYGVQLGTGANASALVGVAVGTNSKAAGNQASVAVGTNTWATGNQSTAFGSNATASGGQSVAIGGAGNTTTNTRSGYGANAAGEQAIAIGGNTQALGGSSIAIGGDDLDAATTTNSKNDGTKKVSTLYQQLTNDTIVAGNYADTKTDGFGAVAIGVQSVATNDLATAFGTRTKASGIASSAFGMSAEASGSVSLAMGTTSRAAAEGAVSVGSESDVSGKNSIAVGRKTIVSGETSAGVGYNNNISAKNAMVLGNNVTVGTGMDGAVVLGNDSLATSYAQAGNATVGGITYSNANFAGNTGLSSGNIVSVGKAGSERQLKHVAAGAITATSTDAINGSQLYLVADKLGTQVTNVGNQVTTLGSQVTNAGNQITNLTSKVDTLENQVKSNYFHVNTGLATQGTGNSSTNHGYITDKAGATGKLAVAAGINTVATGDNSVSVGSNAKATAIDSITVGNAAEASAKQAIAIGKGAKATAENAISIGLGNVVSGANSGAIGDPSIIQGTNSYSLGNNNIVAATSDNVVSIGGQNSIGAKATRDSSGVINTAGTVTPTFDADRTFVMGYQNEIAYNGLANDSVVLGNNNKIDSSNTMVLGNNNDKIKASNTMVLGNSNSDIQAANAMILGNNITNVTGNLNGAVILGNNSSATKYVQAEDATVAGITYSKANFAGNTGLADGNIVSIGSAGAERQLKHVAAGEISATSTDAINGSQLYLVADELGKKINNLSTTSGGTPEENYVHVNDGTNAGGNTTTNKGTVGQAAGAQGKFSVAAGVNATTSAAATNGIAIGQNAAVTGLSATAIGLNSKSSGETSVAIGETSDASGLNAYALGRRATSSGESAFALGTDAKATNLKSIAIGSGTTSGGDRSIAMGDAAQATNLHSFALGGSAKSTANYALAIGNAAQSSADMSIAMGQKSSGGGARGVAIGVESATGAAANDSIAIGRKAKTEAAFSNTIGYNSTVNSKYSTAIGINNTLESTATSSYVLGQLKAGETLHGAANVILGSNSSELSKNHSAVNTDASGRKSSTSKVTEATVGNYKYSGFEGTNPTGVVSVGSVGSERQIINVAAGEISATSTDAINGSQLFATNTVLGNVADAFEAKIGGGLVLDEDGTVKTEPDIANTKKTNVHDAIIAARTIVKSSDNSVSVNPTETNGAFTYDIKVDTSGLAKTDLSNITNAGNSVITNIAKDAVKVINGKNTTVTPGTATNAAGDTIVTYKVDAKDTSASVSAAAGSGLKATKGATTTVGDAEVTNYEIDLDQTTKDQIKKEETVVAGSTNVTVDGTGTNGTGGKEFKVDIAKDLTLDSVTINNGGPTINNAGIDMKGNTITNLGAPVNGGDATNKTYVDTEVAKAKTEVTGGSNTNVVKTTSPADGHDIYKVNADKAEVKVNGAGLKLTPNTVTDGEGTNTTTYTLELDTTTAGTIVNNTDGTTKVNNPTDATKVVTAGDVTTAINNAGWNVTAGAGTGTGTTSGAGTQLVKMGETVTFDAGDNLKLDQNGKTFTYSLAKDIKVDSVSINNGGPTINNAGIDMKGNTITNLGAPVNGGDATNKTYVDGTKTTVASADGSVTVVNKGTGNAYEYDLSVDISKLDAANKDLSNITNAGNTVISNIARNSVKVTKGTNVASVDVNDVVNGDGTTTTTYTVNANGTTVSAGDGVTVTPTGPNATNVTDYKVEVKNTTLTNTPGNSTTVTAGDNNSYAKAGDVATAITNAAKAAKTELEDGKNTTVSSRTGADGQTIYKVDAKDTSASVSAAAGSGLKATKGATTTVGDAEVTNYEIDLDQTTKDQIKKEETVVAGSTNVTVDNTTKNATGGTEFKVDISKNLNLDSVTINNGPTINNNGIDMGNKTITNLGAPVNGGDATNKTYVDTEVAKAKTEVVEGKNTKVTSTVEADGHTKYTVNADKAEVAVTGSGLKLTTNTTPDGDSNKTTYTLELDTTTPGTIVNNTNGTTTLNSPTDSTKVVTAGDVTNAINNAGWNVTAGTGAGTSGANTELVKMGETVTFDSGSNIELVQAGKTFTYSLAKDIKVDSVTINNGGPTITNGGIDMGNKTITNLGAPVNGGDATNKTYVDSTKTEVTSVNNSVKINKTTSGNKDVYDLSVDTDSIAAGTKLTYKANGTNDQTTSLVDGLNFVDGDGTTATVAPNGEVKYSIKNTTLTNTPGNSTTVTAGDNNSYAKAGDVATAITNAAKAAKTELEDGKNTTVSSRTGADGQTIYKVDAKDTSASVSAAGSGLKATKGATTTVGDVEVTDYEIDLDQTTKDQIKKEETVVAGSTNVTVDNTTKNATGGTEFKVDISKNLNLDSVTINNGPTINNNGIDMGNKTITNLGAPVNGGDATNKTYVDTEVAKAKTEVVEGKNTKVTSTVEADGHTKYTVNADKAEVAVTGSGLKLTTNTTPDGDSNKTTYTLELDTTTAGTIVNNTDGTTKVNNPTDSTKVVTAGDVTNAINNAGWNVTAGAGTGTGTTSGANTELVKMGETVTFDAGDNLKLDQNGKTFTYSLANDIKVDSVTINNGGPTITNGGIDMGNKTITNLGAPVNGGDATNKTYVDSTKTEVTSVDNSVKINKTVSGNKDVYDLSVDITKLDAANKDLSNITNAGNSVITNIAKDAVKVIDGKNTTVTQGTDTNAAGDTITTYAVNTDFTSVADAIGGGTTINPVTGAVDTTTSNIGGTGKTNVSDAIKAVAETPLTFAGDSGVDVTRKLGQTTNIKGGYTGTDFTSGNIAVVADGNDTLNIQMAKDLKDLTSVTTTDGAGNTTVTNAGGTTVTNAAGDTTSVGPNGVTITPTTGSPVTLTNTGLNNGGNTITNVADGVNKTDVATVGQLDKKVAESKWQLTTSKTDGDVVNPTVEDINPDEVVTIDAGKNIKITQANNKISIATADDLKVNSITAQDAAGNTTTLNPTGTTVTNNAGDTTKTEAGKTTYTNAAGDTITIGGSTINKIGGNTYTDVADAINAITQKPFTVSANSGAQDTIGIGENIDFADGKNTKVSYDAATNKFVYDADLQSVADAIGGTSTVDPATGDVKAGLSVGGNNYTTVQDALNAVNTTATSSAWKVTTGTKGTGTHAGTPTVDKVGNDDTVTFNAGDNLVVDQNGKDITYSLAKDLTDLTSVTTKDAAGNTTVTNGAGTTTTNATGDTTVTNAGGTTITNAAGDTTKIGADGITTPSITITNPTAITSATGGKASVAPTDTNKVATAGSVADAINALGNNTIKLTDNAGNSTTAVNLNNPGGINFDIKGTTGLKTTANGTEIEIALDTTKLTTDPTGKVDTPADAGKVVTAGDVADAINKAGWNVTSGNTGTGKVNGTSTELINAGETVTFKAGDNLVLDQATNEFTYSLAKDIKVDSLTADDGNGNKTVLNPTGTTITNNAGDTTTNTAGNTVYTTGGNTTTVNGDGLKITNGPSVTTNGIDAGNKVITNVADGKNGTDAVNVSQLDKKVADSKWQLTTSKTDGDVVNPTVEDINPDEVVTIDAGKNIKITQANNKISIATADDLKVNSVTADDGAGNKTTLNPTGTTITNNAGDTTKTEAGKTTYTNAAGDTITIGGSTINKIGGNTYTDVADAINAITQKPFTVSANSGAQDTIGIGENIDFADGKNTKVSYDAATNKFVYDADLQSVADAIGGTSTVDPTTGDVKAGLSVGGSNYTNVQDALNAVNTTATSTAWKVTTGTKGTGTHAGAPTVDKVGNDDTVTFNAGDNLVVDQNGRDITYSLAKDVKVDSLTADDGNGNKTVLNPTGTTITNNAGDTTVTNAGGTTITNAAGDTTKIGPDGITTPTITITNPTAINSATGGKASVAPTDTNKVATAGSVADAINALGDNTIKLTDNAGNSTTAVNLNNPGGINFDIKGTTGLKTTATGTEIEIALDTTKLTTDPTGKVDTPAPADAGKVVTAGDVADAINKAGWNVTSGNTGTGKVNGTSTELINAGETVTFKAGDNLVLDQATNEFTYSLAKDIKVDSLTADDGNGNKTVLNPTGTTITNAAGDTTTNTAGNTVYNTGGNTTTINGDGITTPSITITNPTAINSAPGGKATVAPTDTNKVATAGSVADAINALGDNTIKLTDNAGNSTTAVNLNNPGGINFDIKGTTGLKTTATGTEIEIALDTTKLTTDPTGKVDTPAPADAGKVVTAGDVADAINKAGWNVTSGNTGTGKVNGTSTELINAGETVTFKAGDNLVLDQATNEFTYSLAKDIKVDSLTADDGTGNKTVLNPTGTTITNAAGDTNTSTAAGNTITNAAGDKTVVGPNGITITPTTGSPVSLTNTGLDNGGNTITNVADGVNNTDAATVGQVKAAKTEVTSQDKSVTVVKTTGTDGQDIYDLKVDSTSVAKNTSLTYKANGTNDQTTTLADGLDFKDGKNTTATVDANGEVKYSLNDNIDLGPTGSVQMGDTIVNNGGVTTTNAAGDKTVTNAGGTTITNAAGDTTTNTAGNTVYNTGGNTTTINGDGITTPTITITNPTAINSAPGGKASVTPGDENKVATAGTVADAINALGNNTIKLTDNAGNSTTAVNLNNPGGINFDIKGTTGLKTTANGTEIEIALDTTKLTTDPTGKVDTPAPADAGKVVTAGDVADAINKAGWNVTSGNTGTGKVNGTSTELINAGETVTFKAGDNLVLDQATNEFTYSLAKDIKVDSLTADDGNGNKTVLNPTGTTITNAAGDTTTNTAGNTVYNTGGNTTTINGDGITTPTITITNPTAINSAPGGKATVAPTDTNKVATAGSVADAINALGDNTIKLTDNAGNSTTAVNLNNPGGINFDIKGTTGLKTTANGTEIEIALDTTKLTTDPTGKVDTPAPADAGKVVTAGDVADAINKAGWNVTSGNTGTGKVNGTSTELINAGETVTFKAGDNLVLDQATNEFTYSLAKDIKVDSLTADDGNGNKTVLNPTGTTITNVAGDTNTSTAAGNTITNAAGDKTVVGPNGITITPTTGSPVSLTNTGLDNGGNTINNVASGLDKITTGPATGLVDLTNLPATSTPNTAATVGDLQNMGWVVSSDKKTSNLGSGFDNQVKNANEVKFVGTGAAVVSGDVDASGVNVITVGVNTSSLQASGPVVYTDTAGNTVVKANDGNYYKPSDVDSNGNPVPGATQVTPADVNHSLLNADGTTTTPSKLSNVAPGTISNTSTDAINGSQMKDLGDKLGLTPNTAGTGFDAPTFTGLTNVDGTTAAAPTTFTNAINDTIAKVNQGFKYGADNNSTTPTTQQLGSALTVESGDVTNGGINYKGNNLITEYTNTNGDGKITIGLSETPEFKSVKAETFTADDGAGNTTVTTGAGTTITNATGDKNVSTAAGNTITNAAGDKTEVGPNGITITPTTGSPVSLTNTGLNNGGNVISNVGSNLTKYDSATNGTTPNKDGLVDLTTAPATDAATVGDLQNMGWVVSSDKKTSNLGSGFDNQVKNANEVKFVGTGAAVVSGDVDAAGVNTITVGINTSALQASGPVVYTDTAGNTVVKANDGNYYKPSDVDANGNPVPGATQVAPADVNHSLLNADGTTTTPSKLSNVAPGTISNTSTDAINGSQMKDLGDKLGLTPNTAGTGFDAPTFTGLTNVDGTTAAAPTTFTNAINDTIAKVNQGFKYGADNNSTAPTTQQLGSALTVESGDVTNGGINYKGSNLITEYTNTNGDGKITIGLSETPTFKEITADDGAGNTTVTNGAGTTITNATGDKNVSTAAGNTITNAAGDKTEVGPNGITITPSTPGSNPVSLTNTGLNNGGNVISNVGSNLTKYDSATNGTTPNKDGLVDLTTAPATDAATVGDLQNMGWVVSSDKKTSNLGSGFDNQVKNANEVKFVGTGAAVVSGDVDAAGVNTITVGINTSALQASGPVVYTDTAGNTVVKANDGNYYKPSDVDANGNPVPGATQVAPGDVNHSLLNADGTTTTPSKLSNVAPGTISNTSTDAINGSQMKDLGDKLGLTPNTAGTGFDAPTFTGLTNVDGTTAAAPTTFTNAINDTIAKVNQGFKYGADNNSTTPTTQQLGSALTIESGDVTNGGINYKGNNLITEYTNTNGDGKITIGLSETPEFKSVKAETFTADDGAGNTTVTTGAGTTITNATGDTNTSTAAGNTITNAAGDKTEVGPNGITITPSTPGANPVSLTNTGLNNGGNTITNVAAGVNGTDAVNVDQLKNTVNSATYNGPVVYTNANGDRIVKANDGNYYKATDVDSNGNPLPGAVAVLPTDMKHSLLNADGSTTNPSVLSNVAPGMISNTSTDAINGSQLKDLGDKLGIAPNAAGTGFDSPTFTGLTNVDGTTAAAPTTFTDAINGTIAKVNEGVKYGADNNSTAPTTQQLGSALTIESGDVTSGGINYKGNNLITEYTNTNGDGKITIGLTENPEFKDVKAEKFIADDGAGNSTVTTAAGTTITDAAGNTNVSTAAGNTYTDAAGNTTAINSGGITISPTGGGTSVSLTNTGLSNGGNKITNVAAGVAPTDAVNVSQLDDAVNTLNTSIAAAKTEVVAGTNIANVTKATGANGQDIYTINANGAKTSVGSSYLQVASSTDPVTNVTDYTVDLAQSTKDTIDRVGKGNVALGDNNTVTGDTVYKHLDNNPLSFTDDNGTVISRKLGENLNIVGNATAPLTDGNIGVVANGTDTLEIKLAENIDLGKTGSVTFGDTKVTRDGVQIAGGPSITSGGIDAAGTKITNVAPGDVYDGSTDVVTGGQLYAGIADKATRGEVAKLGSDLAGGIAGVAAMANLPQINDAASNRFNIAVGAGAYKDGRAMAVGFSGVSDGGRVVYKASAALSNRKDLTVGAGIGYQFGKRDIMPNELDRLKAEIALLESEKDSTSRELRKQIQLEAQKNNRNEALIQQLIQEVQNLKNKNN